MATGRMMLLASLTQKIHLFTNTFLAWTGFHLCVGRMLWQDITSLWHRGRRHRNTLHFASWQRIWKSQAGRDVHIPTWLNAYLTTVFAVDADTLTHVVGASRVIWRWLMTSWLTKVLLPICRGKILPVTASKNLSCCASLMKPAARAETKSHLQHQQYDFSWDVPRAEEYRQHRRWYYAYGNCLIYKPSPNQVDVDFTEQAVAIPQDLIDICMLTTMWKHSLMIQVDWWRS